MCDHYVWFTMTEDSFRMWRVHAQLLRWTLFYRCKTEQSKKGGNLKKNTSDFVAREIQGHLSPLTYCHVKRSKVSLAVVFVNKKWSRGGEYGWVGCVCLSKLFVWAHVRAVLSVRDYLCSHMSTLRNMYWFKIIWFTLHWSYFIIIGKWCAI